MVSAYHVQDVEEKVKYLVFIRTLKKDLLVVVFLR
jgi:hypothetical protein